VSASTPSSAGASLAIVIVTFNRSTLLAELLDSVVSMDDPPIGVRVSNVIIVDNASSDDTQDIIATWQPQIDERFGAGTLINDRLDENTGGSGGFSEGTRVALEHGADWIWVMDDDVEILPEALTAFEPWMERFKVIHGRRYDFDGSPFYWQARFNIFLGVPLPYTLKDFNREGYALTNSGTFEGMLYHRSVPMQIGLPDPRFFITWDDATYAWLASLTTEVVYVDAFVIKRKREQRQISLGIRHLNDGSPLFRFHIMRNRAIVGRYFDLHGRLNRVGFALGTALTFGKEVFRLVFVQHTLKGVGDLVRGWREGRKIWSDTTWQPMPALEGKTGGKA
jgi:rhamnopyranosyl-N-acetylglucosaminyl-diphospho-decaprenol beta-1,3/1,4-galactofuranosyltransferase